MPKVDMLFTEPVVLQLTRPSYRDAQIVLLAGDAYHYNENDDAQISMRQATEKEIDIELATRGHRAETKGSSEMRRA